MRLPEVSKIHRLAGKFTFTVKPANWPDDDAPLRHTFDTLDLAESCRSSWLSFYAKQLSGRA